MNLPFTFLAPAPSLGTRPSLGTLALALLLCSLGLAAKDPATARSRISTASSPFNPPATAEEWEERSEELKLRLLVANGLYPMPEKTPLNPVIHGKVERPGFTVEKVYFESVPGLYVTGLLFRPENPKKGKLPAVLCPHGHGGRLHDLGKAGVRRQIVIGAERFEESGRMPKIARCGTLARLGCVTFLYDMMGYADNRQISYQLAHRFSKQRPGFEGSDSWGLYSARPSSGSSRSLGFRLGIPSGPSISSPPCPTPTRAVSGSPAAVAEAPRPSCLGPWTPGPLLPSPNGMVSSSMQEVHLRERKPAQDRNGQRPSLPPSSPPSPSA